MSLLRAFPTLAVALVLSLFFACGGAKPSPAASPGTAGAAAAAPGAATGPLDALDPQAHVAIHLDMARLRPTPLFQAVLLAGRQGGATEKLDAASRECGFPVLDAPGDILLTWGDDGGALVMTVSVPPGQFLDCIRKLAGGTEDKLDGAPALRLGDDKPRHALVQGGMLFAGDDAPLRRALHAKAGDSPLASRVALSGDAVGAVWGDVNEGPVHTVSGTLRASEQLFAMDVAVEMTSEQAATQFAQVAQGAMGSGAGAPAGAVPKGFERVIAADGKTLKLHIGAKGSVEEQVATVGMLSTLAIAGVRRYLARAKSAEAEATVRAIAKDLEAYVEGERSAHKAPRFPPPAPPVPAEIPRAGRYQSSAADWAAPTWKAIAFSMTEPQFFRYSVATGADRKHAMVRAEGDLNGDGKASLYELPLEIDKKGQVAEGQLKVVEEP
jgi:hypothetical protein